MPCRPARDSVTTANLQTCKLANCKLLLQARAGAGGGAAPRHGWRKTQRQQTLLMRFSRVSRQSEKRELADRANDEENEAMMR